MNEIQRIDEHWRDNLLGLTFSKRLEKAIMQRHCLELGLERAQNRADRIRSQIAKLDGQPLKKYAASPLNTLESLSEGALVTVLASKTKKILDIGFNTQEDLILDNFGLWFGGLIRTPGTTNTSVSLTDYTNTARTVPIYFCGSSSTCTFNCTVNNVNLGTYLELGSGTTAAARSNYKIQTNLGSAPENTFFGSSNGGYANGTGSLSFSGAISAGGSGTINETGLFGAWAINYYTAYNFMLFHDILGAGVTYVAGNTLNASYAVTM